MKSFNIPGKTLYLRIT